MEAEIRDLDIEQGTDIVEFLQIVDSDGTPFDMTGWTFDFKAKRDPSPDSPVAFAWDVELVADADPELNNRWVRISLPRARTLAVVAGDFATDDESKFWYDWDATDSLDRCVRILKGSITLHRDIRGVA
jgi:hypothetical protein